MRHWMQMQAGAVSVNYPWWIQIGSDLDIFHNTRLPLISCRGPWSAEFPVTWVSKPVLACMGHTAFQGVFLYLLILQHVVNLSPR
mmetsp:Transcript_133327/g.266010  ORF Transcript_133327/g.266010 Transcript_133327/m.266010 type:complete len:85 (-) Transcript_133327:693-947(-)